MAKNNHIDHPEWRVQAMEIYNHCKDCKYYFTFQREFHLNEMEQTIHRCKALTELYSADTFRGYFPRFSYGQICPITNKSVSSKGYPELMTLQAELNNLINKK